MTIDEYQQQKHEYIVTKHELSMKKLMGMPMSYREQELHEKIDALIDQCDAIIDYMVLENEDDYDWTWGID